MRCIVVTDPGTVELNFMWLPTFIGMNSRMKMDLEAELAPKLVGMELTDDGLNAVHDLVLDAIVAKFPAIPGLRDYLDAMKFVQDA